MICYKMWSGWILGCFCPAVFFMVGLGTRFLECLDNILIQVFMGRSEIIDLYATIACCEFP